MKISTSFSLVILLVSLTTLHAADPPHAPVAGDSGTAANQPRNPSIETQEPVAEPPDETRAVVTIDSGAPSVRCSPMIFGGFPEHFERQIYGGLFEPGSPLADARGFRRDALAALKELKVPIPPLFPALRSASTAVSEAIRPKQILSSPGKHAWEPRASVVGGSNAQHRRCADDQPQGACGAPVAWPGNLSGFRPSGQPENPSQFSKTRFCSPGANNSLIYWDSQTQLIEISGRSCLKSSRFSSHFLGCLP